MVLSDHRRSDRGRIPLAKLFLPGLRAIRLHRPTDAG
jgi:hypothetical protein